MYVYTHIYITQKLAFSPLTLWLAQVDSVYMYIFAHVHIYVYTYRRIYTSHRNCHPLLSPCGVFTWTQKCTHMYTIQNIYIYIYIFHMYTHVYHATFIHHAETRILSSHTVASPSRQDYGSKNIVNGSGAGFCSFPFVGVVLSLAL